MVLQIYIIKSRLYGLCPGGCGLGVIKVRCRLPRSRGRAGSGHRGAIAAAAWDDPGCRVCGFAGHHAGGRCGASLAGDSGSDVPGGRGCAVPVLQGERQCGRYGCPPAGEVGRKSPEFLFHRF